MRRFIVTTTALFALVAVLDLFAASCLRAQTSAWEPMNRGLQHTLVYTIAIDPADSLVMYCGTDFGRLYKSVDGGFNWILHNSGIPESYRKERVTALCIDPADRSRLYAGFSGRESKKNLFMSTDAGGRWEIIDTPDEWTEGGILHILRTTGIRASLVCGLGWSRGIFVSRDLGRTWSRKLPSLGIQCVASHPDRPWHMLAGASSITTLSRSEDAGETWETAQTGIPRDQFTGARCLAYAPSDPDVVYAGITGHGAGLYVSTDAGLTWAPLNGIKEISEIAIHPWNEDIIYISAIHSGVHRSLDGGLTWTTINEGLPTTEVMRVLIAPGYPVRVFAVTLEHGIYRMVDEELREDLFTR